MRYDRFRLSDDSTLGEDRETTGRDEVVRSEKPKHRPPSQRSRHQQGDAPTNRQATKRAADHERTAGVQHIDDLLRPLSGRSTPPQEDELNALAKQMADHLLTCESCQKTLAAIIERLTIQAVEGSPERVRGVELLERFNAVLTKVRVRKDIEPYAAILYQYGEARARHQFPDLAAHLDECETCRVEVEARRRYHVTKMGAETDGEDS
jgi:hypothetical protein